MIRCEFERLVNSTPRPAVAEWRDRAYLRYAICNERRRATTDGTRFSRVDVQTLVDEDLLVDGADRDVRRIAAAIPQRAASFAQDGTTMMTAWDPYDTISRLSE